MDSLENMIRKKIPLGQKTVFKKQNSSETLNHTTFGAFRLTETQWPKLTNPSLRKDYVKQNGKKTINIQHNLPIKRCKWQIADPTKKLNSHYNKFISF